MITQNIFPERDKFVGRTQKESLIKQRGIVIWFTGLSGAGKSTLARELEKLMANEGFLTEVLDGDKIRNGLNNNLGFTIEDRVENIRRIAEVSKLFCNAGIITISAFISPTNQIRKMAKQIIGENDYFEVFVDASLEVCEQRDPKGLYNKARKGIIKDFTGVSAPYEVPESPNYIVNTEKLSVEECTQRLFDKLIARIKPTH